MFHGVERKILADAQAELPGPHAAGENHPVRVDRSGSSVLGLILDSRDASEILFAVWRRLRLQPLHADLVKQLCPVLKRAPGQRHRAFARNNPAVAGQINRTEHIFDLDQRPQLLRLARSDQVSLHAEHLGHRGRAAQLNHALGIGPERQPPRLDPSNIMPRLSL